MSEEVGLTLWLSIAAAVLIVLFTQVRSCDGVTEVERTKRTEVQHRAFTACIQAGRNAAECRMALQ